MWSWRDGRLALLVGLALSLLPVHSVRGQTEELTFFSSEENIAAETFGVEPGSGQLMLFPVFQRGWWVPFRFVQLIKDPAVQKHVELKPEQLKLIDEILAREKPSRLGLTLGKPQWTREPEIAQTWELEFRGVVRDLLTSRQQERLVEADLLYLLRRRGIKWFLFQPGIQTTLGFDDRVAGEILEELSQLRDDCIQQRNRLVESTHDKLLSVLDKPQREAIQETLQVFLKPSVAAGSAAPQFGRSLQAHFKPLETNYEHPTKPLELLACQLSNLEIFSDNPLEDDLKKFRGLAYLPQLYPDLRGNLVFGDWQGFLIQYSKGSSEKRRQIAESINESLAMGLFHYLQQSEFFSRDLELADWQRSQIAEVIAEDSAINDALSALPDSQGHHSAEETRLFRKRYEHAIRAAWNLDSILLPHQFRALAFAAELNEITQFGLAAVLHSGELGRRLRLSPDQRREIEAIARQQLQEIANQTQKLEGKLLRFLVKSLQQREIELNLDPDRLESLDQRVDIDVYLLGLLPAKPKEK